MMFKNPPPHNVRTEQPEREVIRPDTKADVEALLALALEDTRALPRTIETFSANRDHWTPWSEAHDYLNDLLQDWQAASA